MEHSSSDSQSSHTSDESSVDGSEVSVEDLIRQYVKQNPDATNTILFSVLGLLNLYVPESYLLMTECQQILGPPDPNNGAPPFENRMEPFTRFIRTSGPNPGQVCLVNQTVACCAVEIVVKRISRSDTVMKMMFSLCGAEVQPHVLQFIKDLLTKREMGENGKEKFSRLVQDILEHEGFYRALTVLMTASNKFEQSAILPQVVSRLNYLGRQPPDFESAEHWAKKAIDRAPVNSYIADTLGQVYKNNLLRVCKTNETIMRMAEKAFRAFKDVESKADKEVQPQMDTEGSTPTSESFNNRGLFGFLQVAKIAFEKIEPTDQQPNGLIQNKRMEVEAKFEFFEWYLTYSMPDETTSEPKFFWKDVALCYKHYTTNNAAESTSFPGLLYCLNLGLFTSRGRCAMFQEEKKSGADLEEIQEVLKNTYEENVDDVHVAERYILSNIILSNRMSDSSQLASVEQLKTIILRFLGTENAQRSPEFYLLVLLLLWPGEQPPVVQDKDEEEEQPSKDDDECSDDRSSEEKETQGESEQLPLDPDLQQYVTFMEQAYERSKYAKYLRSRYLLPLFFLGKGSGLSKWIHKSRLDGIVENTVETELAGEGRPPNLDKKSRIKEMWMTGEVWQVPEIQNILLPVRVEHNVGGVFVWARGRKIKVSTEVEPRDSRLSSMRFYLGLNIKGPVVFKVSVPPAQ